MFITVLFKGSIKEYTYEAPNTTAIGIYALDDKLVLVNGIRTTKPTFETKEFEGVYVQGEMYNRHLALFKKASENEDWTQAEIHASRLKWLKEGRLNKYMNCADFEFIADYVDLLG